MRSIRLEATPPFQGVPREPGQRRRFSRPRGARDDSYAGARSCNSPFPAPSSTSTFHQLPPSSPPVLLLFVASQPNYTGCANVFLPVRKRVSVFLSSFFFFLEREGECGKRRRGEHLLCFVIIGILRLRRDLKKILYEEYKNRGGDG